MKVLIIQAARFGDCYCSWPAIRAYRRRHPEHVIHVLVRERFQDSLIGLGCVDEIKVLKTGDLLKPLIEGAKVEEALVATKAFLNSLRQENYDCVYNLSFSPLSANITEALHTETNRVFGYHRHSDGHLALTDDWSAYFYAQIGVQKPNRIHLSEIFAGVLRAPLSFQDWSADSVETAFSRPEQPYIVVHLGASQVFKTVSPLMWSQIIEKILRDWHGQIILIGSAEEMHLADHLVLQGSRLQNWIGKTQIQDLFPLIKYADLLIGADSAPIHIATLVNTTVINLSAESVNLWETGPLSPGSRIITGKTLANTELVAEEVLLTLQGQRPAHASHYVTHERQIVSLQESQPPPEWRLIEFLYFEKDCPDTSDIEFATALVNLFDLNHLAMEQLDQLERDPQDKVARTLMAKVDELLEVLKLTSPIVGVLVRWFYSQRVKIPPGTFVSILEQTFSCHREFAHIINQLQQHVNVAKMAEEHGGNINMAR